MARMDNAFLCLYAEDVVECNASRISPLAADDFGALILLILESADG